MLGFIINASFMILIYFMIVRWNGWTRIYIQFISEVCNFSFYFVCEYSKKKHAESALNRTAYIPALEYSLASTQSTDDDDDNDNDDDYVETSSTASI